MKWAFSLTCLLILIVACGKTEGVWDELDAADRAAITTRAYNECKDETNGDFNAFKEESELVYSSSDWQRSDAWKHELKNGATVDTTHNIRVWRNDGTDLYLLINRVIGSNTRVYFLRIPKAINLEMIEDLQEQFCRKQVAVSTNSSRVTVEEEYVVPTGTDTKEYTDTYRFDFDYLAYMGSAWNVTRLIVTKDDDDDETGRVTLTSTFVEVDPDTLADLKPTYTEYVGATFCEITEPAEDVATGISFVVPYVVSETCASTLPVGWTL